MSQDAHLSRSKLRCLPILEWVVMLLIALPMPGDLYWWSLAGPWTTWRFYGGGAVIAVAGSLLLGVGMAAVSWRANLLTAALSCGSAFAWWTLGQGMLCLSV